MIRLEGVCKVFDGSGKDPLAALGPVDLEIESGRFISLLGPSGCGKTTLLHLIAGLEPPSRGRVLFRDREVRAPVTEVGFVFQRPMLVDWRTVLGNVLLPAELRGRPPEEYRSRAETLLSSVGLAEFLGASPYTLSGGMQQRASLCQALVLDPSTVLLDEPLGALDALTRRQVQRDLEKLFLSSEKTFVLVTHSIEEAIDLSDVIYVMTPRPGQVRERIAIDLPRPRSGVRRGPRFLEYEERIEAIFTSYGML